MVLAQHVIISNGGQHQAMRHDRIVAVRDRAAGQWLDLDGAPVNVVVLEVAR